MAEQLNDTNSELVYIDFSISSMHIAQRRVKMRGRLNVVWVKGWVESIPFHGLGHFNYVSSTGVLHHLKSPDKGLRVLNNIQSNEGGGIISVYGRYGRSGVYQIQDLMQTINIDKPIMDSELRRAKSIIEALPENHWIYHAKSKDMKINGDSGIYDLFLHKRDVSYTMIDFYNYISRNGYEVVGYSQPEFKLSLSLKYVIRDPKLYRLLTKLNVLMRFGIEELISGKIFLPELLVSKRSQTEADLKLNENVVFINGNPIGFQQVLKSKRSIKKLRGVKYLFADLYRTTGRISTNRKESTNTKIVSKKAKKIGTVLWPHSKFSDFVMNKLTKFSLQHHQVSSLTEEFNELNNLNLTIMEGKNLFADFYSYIKDTGFLLVKHKSVPAFPLTSNTRYYYLEKSD